MIWFTHLNFGIMLSFLFGLKANMWLLIFSLIPDIDNPNTLLGKFLPGISDYLYKTFGHRGLFHSIYWSLLLGLLSFVETNCLFMFVGYTSHIVLDLFTPSGVQLFYPNKARFVIFDGPVETSSAKDVIIGFIFMVLTCVIVELGFSLKW
ncbi:MAG: metal-dependent hydrolase [Candidatus Nanoarchaeia archaeon]|jgi:inner membrane protein